MAELHLHASDVLRTLAPHVLPEPAKADEILHWLLMGYSRERIEALGFSRQEVALVQRRLDSTHWKRKLPTVAVLSQTAINEFYLRPVDY